MKALMRFFSHIIFRQRRKCNKLIRIISEGVTGKRILEIGSGKKMNGKYIYSYIDYFDKSNEFVMSDITKRFGHKIVDITKMRYNSKFDIILCTNVLEHCFDFKEGVSNIHRALKKNGKAVFYIPFIYPLHDEPGDYLRYTEHALKKVFNKFSKVDIKHYGIRQFPTSYSIIAVK